MLLVKELDEIDEVEGFTSALKALDHVKHEGADIALLDIDMPDMNGLMLAAKIKEASPHTAIIFLTGFSEHALKAIEMHASGYLVKPVNKNKLKEEIDYAIESMKKSDDTGGNGDGGGIFLYRPSETLMYLSMGIRCIFPVPKARSSLRIWSTDRGLW